MRAPSGKGGGKKSEINVFPEYSIPGMGKGKRSPLFFNEGEKGGWAQVERGGAPSAFFCNKSREEEGEQNKHHLGKERREMYGSWSSVISYQRVGKKQKKKEGPSYYSLP